MYANKKHFKKQFLILELITEQPPQGLGSELGLASEILSGDYLLGADSMHQAQACIPGSLPCVKLPHTPQSGNTHTRLISF